MSEGVAHITTFCFTHEELTSSPLAATPRPEVPNPTTPPVRALLWGWHNQARRDGAAVPTTSFVYPTVSPSQRDVAIFKERRTSKWGVVYDVLVSSEPSLLTVFFPAYQRTFLLSFFFFLCMTLGPASQRRTTKYNQTHAFFSPSR